MSNFSLFELVDWIVVDVFCLQLELIGFTSIDDDENASSQKFLIFGGRVGNEFKNVTNL